MGGVSLHNLKADYIAMTSQTCMVLAEGWTQRPTEQNRRPRRRPV